MKAEITQGMVIPMGNLAARIKQTRKAAGLSQEKFAEALGEVDGVRITRGAVGNWELGGGISRANLTAISDKFNVALDWLERGKGIEPTTESVGIHLTPLTTSKSSAPHAAQRSGTIETFPHNARIGEPVTGFARVPIRGQAMGGKDGALTFNTDQNMGDILAPPILMGVPDAYAVYVAGDSMLERYRDGEVVYVHPHRRVVKGDDCVIQIAMGDGLPPHGWVKRFISMDDKTLKVQQLNPKKTLTFKRNRVISVHKIVMGGPV